MKLSIITINLNNRAGLEKTILSVLAQDTRDFEFIIIDGLSTDGSADLLGQYRDLITFSVSEKDSGIYEAQNKGIARSAGQYLQFLNSGDTLYEKNTISKVLPHLQRIDIVYGNMKIWDKGTVSDGFMPGEITVGQMVRDTLWHPVSFISRKLFDTVGLFDTSFKIVADYDFFFRAILVHQCKTKHIKQFIVVFNMDGMSSDIKNVTTIRSEKQRVQQKYLTAEEIELHSRVPGKNGYFKRLLKKWFP